MAIMDFSKTALKNLRSRPATLMYPARKREFFERTRGHIDIKIEDCIYCGICMRRCPSKAIAVVKGDKSWGIDRLKCVQCNACVENCPKEMPHDAADVYNALGRAGKGRIPGSVSKKYPSVLMPLSHFRNRPRLIFNAVLH